jgi:hypothetical protein
VQRPVVHFGHARWRDEDQETMDAARWLAESPDHQLVVNEGALTRCFQASDRKELGRANRSHWYLVSGAVDAVCVRGGRPNVSYSYNPPRQRPRGTVEISHRIEPQRPIAWNFLRRCRLC